MSAHLTVRTFPGFERFEAPYHAVAFRCEGCGRAVRVEGTQGYYVDRYGLAPYNLYCEDCAKLTPEKELASK